MSNCEHTIVTVLGERSEKLFWSKVQKSHECWLWTGSKTPAGYGHINIRSHWFYAHRLSYEMRYGARIMEGRTLDHLCRTPSCVNPEHLEPVSDRENILRGGNAAAKNAQKTHCGTCGRPFDQENTRISLKGNRSCRACNRRTSSQEYNARGRERRRKNKDHINAGQRRRYAAKREQQT